MRLIDADVLANKMIEIDDDVVRACIGVIMTERTAYNVEKVLWQIKDYFFEVIDNCEEDIVPHEILEYNKAICEIVRNGGVE